MTDLFGQLLRRARGEAGLLPAIPARFEPVELGADAWGEVEELVPAADRGRRAPGPQVGRSDRLQGPPASPARQPDAAQPEIERVVETSSSRALSPADAEPREDARLAQPVAPPAIDIAAIVADALRERGRAESASRVPVVTAADESTPTGRSEPETSAAPAASAAPTTVAGPAPVRPAVAVAVPPAAPAIEVRIGRIEVTAPPAASRPTPAPVALRTRAVSLSLREYLARRGRK